MTRRHTYNSLILVIVLCAALISTMAISSSAFGATGRTNACSGDLCGSYGGGGGTHHPGGSGRGRFGGRAGVSFGYTPIPQLTECTPSAADNNRAEQFDYKPYEESRPWYAHYLSATQRSTGAVVGGWPGTAYWGIGWNSNTGLPDEDADDLGSAGGVGNDEQLFGPTWTYGTTFCLPLKGGALIEAMLNQAKPVLEGFPGTKDRAAPGKAILKMKKSYIDVSIDEKELSNNGINISFQVRKLYFLICDEGKLDKWVKESNPPKPPESFGITHCKLGTDSKSPVKIDTNKINYDTPRGADSVRHLKVAVKYKKKGKFSITAIAVFHGQVDINGALAEARNIEKISDTIYTNVQSSKAVNRKKGK